MAGGKSNRGGRKPQQLRDAIAARKVAERDAKNLYKAHVKEMRPFLKKLKKIDLRKNLSPGQKSFVTKAFEEYRQLTTRPVAVVRPRSKKNLEKLQSFSRHPTSGPKFDVAFVPAATPNAKVKIKKDRIEVTAGGVTVVTLLFDIKKLTANPDEEIRRTLEKAPHVQQFVIIAGKYLYNGGMSRSLVAPEVRKLMERYNNPRENNFYENWLHGVEGYNGNLRDVEKYRTEYREGSNRAKSRNKGQRRREKATRKARRR